MSTLLDEFKNRSAKARAYAGRVITHSPTPVPTVGLDPYPTAERRGWIYAYDLEVTGKAFRGVTSREDPY
jgi:hypothetical protein